ncbi:MAG: hypothetical protein A2161_08965 [Candidatus Schekmanbacteria bacterium RBG_13_48_7]|uniref:Polymerase beta nucleotidyltransferase domain-containing protein n=1 Tax=Candidatus Schekmanbacteria bacterium RBG_13_48_7 TaxID=1817878 RepID=A0A1F7RMG6_9BACT|nr:MAG: hypothetical protein A2161_08965 [Candidatus Schekmanbacteria bacterium RBG_13_48_7]
MNKVSKIPASYQKDIEKAIKILKEAGCAEVLLFGSLIEGKVKDGSDIDLAIRGCPRGMYFSLVGKLLLELDHPVDLVNLDINKELADYLEREGNLVHVS